jgi:hypothetical protein
MLVLLSMMMMVDSSFYQVISMMMFMLRAISSIIRRYNGLVRCKFRAYK